MHAKPILSRMLALFLAAVMLAVPAFASDAESVSLPKSVIRSVVEHSLTILTADSETYTNARAFIEANPDAFAIITALGEAALEPLYEISEGYADAYASGDLSAYRRAVMAMAAANAIDPELYDNYYPSPDGKYTIRARAESFLGISDPTTTVVHRMSLIDCESGEVLAEFSGSSSHAEVIWSADGRYAAVTDRLWEEGLPSQIVVFDVVGRRTIAMPYHDMLTRLLRSMPEMFKMRTYDNRFVGWYGEHSIRIAIDMQTGTPEAPGKITGWYQYDLKKGRITAMAYTIEEAEA